ncbi:MAG: hypothetical protein HRT89_11795 [Lentisphaeria bacterium]|nr:hypothetical protein [Lentisphaeria bacterium]NQZ68739.1 hypothetical protein [Lentisphaeria bacterium]
MRKEHLKKETELLIDDLPEDASWDDLMYKIYVRKKIDKGLDDCANNRTLSSEEMRQKISLK